MMGMFDPAYKHLDNIDVPEPLAAFTLAASFAAVVKYLSRYMNEHAMMIASFFRVNAKCMRAKQPLMLDLSEFARQCKEDIANGPNPPPPPVNPAAEAENRRQNNLVDEVMKMPTIMAAYK